MIPKKIHYCWFGGNPIDDASKKCIESWKKYCPDYEIIEWNESNYDVNKNKYTSECYKNKKWAFLTDYVRLDIIYNEGGIYLDTDVELLKPLDDLLDCKGYLGMEQVGTVNTGEGFGAVKHHDFVKSNKEYYENHNFWDKNGEFHQEICVKITTDILSENGFVKKNEKQNVCDMNIYPVEYFCPLVMGTNKLKITDNTYSIHHFNASWYKGNKLVKKIKYYTIPLKQFIKKVLHINGK